MAICVLDPTSEEAVATSHRAARLSSLAGRMVGLLDNGKLWVHELLNHLETLLRTEHGVAEVLRFKKPDASRLMPPEVLAAMHACDAVISGVGDWGSCSSCSVHDALSAEKAGISATAIITDRFVHTAQTMADVSGMPGYPVVVLGHPLANNDDATLRVKAQEAVQQCLQLLQAR